jgi:hypothetical protein
MDLIQEVQLLQNSPYPPTLLALAQGLHGEVEGKSILLKRRTAPSHLLIPFDHQDLQPLLGEKTTTGEPCHSCPDDDDIRIRHDRKV